MTVGRQPIPLAARRCTKCGRGVTDGATFQRRYECGSGSYRAVCRDCDNARARTLQRIRRGWDADRAATAPPQRYTTIMPPAETRDDAPTGGRVAPRHFAEVWEGED